MGNLTWASENCLLFFKIYFFFFNRKALGKDLISIVLVSTAVKFDVIDMVKNIKDNSICDTISNTI